LEPKEVETNVVTLGKNNSQQLSAIEII